MDVIAPERSKKTRQKVKLNCDKIMANINELRPMLQARSNEIDEARAIPDDIVESLREAGVFRMMVARSRGGPEMNPMQVNDALEELSVGNASVAWCAMIQMDSGQYSGLLDRDVARKLYPHLDMTTSNVVQPKGRAQKTKGGYIVNGVWHFASGCQHTDWFSGGCHVFEKDSDIPLKNENGKPLYIMILGKREQFIIHDTWYTTGLRGTGSNDVEAVDLFVPAENTFSFNFRENVSPNSPLYSWPSILTAKMSGVVLGIARSAIETAVLVIREREIKSEQALLSITDAQVHYASAKNYVNNSLEALWAKLEKKSWPNKQERLAVFLSRANAFHSSRKAVQIIYDAMGASAVYTHKMPMDRHLRDINTACQHIVAQRRAQQAVADLMLGGEGEAVPFS
ncbi:MAG: hypothetical protein GXP18_06690 [Gammaproteobacteria bacterium]|nr:hypothetical protein [Gammaproteobacteria bacterium]